MSTPEKPGTEPAPPTAQSADTERGRLQAAVQALRETILQEEERERFVLAGELMNHGWLVIDPDRLAAMLADPELGYLHGFIRQYLQTIRPGNPDAAPPA